MPTFYKDVEAEVDVDIEEFVDECSDREIQILIRYMVEEGKLTVYGPSQNLSVNETIWYETIEKIRSNRLTLTDEEIDIIENIAKRF
jgi:hypothetical protein